MQQTARALGGAVDAAGGLIASRPEIMAGLMARQKRLAPKFLYDERGSELFDEICTLPEYYATRTEVALLREHGEELAELVGPDAHVVELGAGSSMKARLLLGTLDQPASYLPVDISAAYLERQAADVAAAYPAVTVRPVIADFTRPFALPAPTASTGALLFFPGSTIGNLSRVHAGALLTSLAERMQGATLLIGVDACHDADVLRAAYNDSRGVTADFNLNLLVRLNRELGADFAVDCFTHEAVYDERQARIEMRLISKRDQLVRIDDVEIPFRAGEYIVSEHSHKYAPEEFARMASMAGWRPARCWLDSTARFSLHICRAT
jgi:L-histidine N-alpha-methyltransferase